MFQIHKSTEKVAKLFVYPNLRGKPPLPATVGKYFRFGELKKGESIFIRHDEFSEIGLKDAMFRCRMTVSQVNKKYAVFFVVVKHSDKFEVARME